MTPTLRHPITETEVEVRMRLARERSGQPATEAQMRAGAAAGGVYYPAQTAWNGHNEDVLFDGAGTAPPWYGSRIIAASWVAIVLGCIALLIWGR